MAQLHPQLANETFDHPFVIVSIVTLVSWVLIFLQTGKMLVDVANAKLSWPSSETPLLVETTPSVNKLSVLLENYSDMFINGLNDPLG